MTTMTLDTYDETRVLPAPRTPSYRLTRRGRAVVVVLALLVMAMAAVAYASGSVASGTRKQDTKVVVVQPGQTLWGIASDVTGGSDVAAMETRIEAINKLTSPSVEAGQRLRVPRD